MLLLTVLDMTNELDPTNPGDGVTRLPVDSPEVRVTKLGIEIGKLSTALAIAALGRIGSSESQLAGAESYKLRFSDATEAAAAYIEVTLYPFIIVELNKQVPLSRRRRMSVLRKDPTKSQLQADFCIEPTTGMLFEPPDNPDPDKANWREAMLEEELLEGVVETLGELHSNGFDVDLTVNLQVGQPRTPISLPAQPE